MVLTDTVDEDAGQNEVVHVEHRPSSEPYDVRDVGVGLRAARVKLNVSDRVETYEVELAICLVVRHVAFLCLLHQVQLGGRKRTCANRIATTAHHNDGLRLITFMLLVLCKLFYELYRLHILFI